MGHDSSQFSLCKFPSPGMCMTFAFFLPAKIIHLDDSTVTNHKTSRLPVRGGVRELTRHDFCGTGHVDPDDIVRPYDSEALQSRQQFLGRVLSMHDELWIAERSDAQ